MYQPTYKQNWGHKLYTITHRFLQVMRLVAEERNKQAKETKHTKWGMRHKYGT